MPTWQFRAQGGDGFVASNQTSHKAVRIWHDRDVHYEAQVQVPGAESGELTDEELASLVEELGAHAGAKFESTGTRNVREPRRHVARRIYKLIRVN
jgi:hypothetical protein